MGDPSDDEENEPSQEPITPEESQAPHDLPRSHLPTPKAEISPSPSSSTRGLTSLKISIHSASDPFANFLVSNLCPFKVVLKVSRGSRRLRFTAPDGTVAEAKFDTVVANQDYTVEFPPNAAWDLNKQFEVSSAGNLVRVSPHPLGS